MFFSSSGQSMTVMVSLKKVFIFLRHQEGQKQSGQDWYSCSNKSPYLRLLLTSCCFIHTVWLSTSCLQKAAVLPVPRRMEGRWRCKRHNSCFCSFYPKNSSFPEILISEDLFTSYYSKQLHSNLEVQEHMGRWVLRTSHICFCKNKSQHLNF